MLWGEQRRLGLCRTIKEIFFKMYEEKRGLVISECEHHVSITTLRERNSSLSSII